MDILVVDDERAVRESLRRALELEGYTVELAADGEEALARMRTEPLPDVVILDILMPGVDGLEVCRRLRADAVTVPVLMLTARTEIDSRVAGLDAGADDYLPSPSRSPSSSRASGRSCAGPGTETRQTPRCSASRILS